MWTKIKAIANIVWGDIKDTYSRVKIYILGILTIIAILEWRKLKEIALVKLGQKEMASTNKQDSSLSKTEASDNAQANVLVKDAQQLPNTEQPVQENWYVDKKDSQ